MPVTKYSDQAELLPKDATSQHSREGATEPGHRTIRKSAYCGNVLGFGFVWLASLRYTELRSIELCEALGRRVNMGDRGFSGRIWSHSCC